jgi:molecular chaperone HscB
MSTHFDLLNLPRGFPLDPAAIEAAYLARSRELHPDYHQQGSSAEQRMSVELSAALNEAYAVLRDPFRRADYLLQLAGAADHKDMPADFLEEMLELRMEIEELREAGAADSPGRQAMEARLNRRRDDLVQEIAKVFERNDSLLAVRKLLNSAKYIQGLLRDLRAD